MLMILSVVMTLTLFSTVAAGNVAAQETSLLTERAAAAMKSAANYFHSKVAVHGGYVYRYSLDLTERDGEGKAAATEIWVQPPGTPTVGIAYVRAWEATGDPVFLNAAIDAARALIHGQLESGGWTASIDFDPQGKNTDRYRNGKGRSKGKNYSTLDDNKSQSAIRLLIEVDRATDFKDAEIHEAVVTALKALLAAQFPNGGFPQGWKAPVPSQPVIKASFPNYDWRTENRIKDYWDFYTLNDGLAGDVLETLVLAEEVYKDPAFRQAMIRLGDFLILAQLPEPQPAWAQQYNFQMHPMWARRFEPPAVVGSESVDVMQTLMSLAELTGDKRFLKPVLPALEWLKRSRLPDGQNARFYELQTNRPLYFTRETYELTYDDSNLPTHYGFKSKLNLERVEQHLAEMIADGRIRKSVSSLNTLSRDAERIVAELDDQGRWVTDKSGKAVPVSSPGNSNATPPADACLLSAVFTKNLERLSEYLRAVKTAAK